jgi:hypothetical protein
MRVFLYLFLLLGLMALPGVCYGQTTPYLGQPLAIPGRIEAEHFDLGGQNNAYYDLDTGNQGGAFRTSEAVDIGSTTDDNGLYTIGWFSSSEWLVYTVNVTQSGDYELGLRVANASTGGAFQVLVDGQVKITTMAVPVTDTNWSLYQTIKAPLTLTSGTHQLMLKATQNAGNGYAGNLNYLTFTLTGTNYNPDGDYDYEDVHLLRSWFNLIAPFNYLGSNLMDIFDFNYVLKRIITPPLTPTSTPQPPPPTITPTPGLVSPTPTFPPTTGSTVTVDMAADRGPVTYRATGFIGNISDTKPPDALILPLKPQLLSWNRSYSSINRTMQNGITLQLKLHNLGTIPSTADGDWSAWEKLVYDRAMEAKTKNYTGVEFDIWNEPEFGQYWSGAIDERYYQMWLRAYRKIKEVDPAFIVAGPSSTSFGWTKGDFLTRAMAEKAVPDVLTYHELWSGGSGVAARVEEMRNYLASKGYPNWKISINEYDGDGDARLPGTIVRFMYEFELGRVHSASKACWQEGGDWNCEVHLNNTLTYPDQKPRGVWHAYKAYADMSGTMVQIYPSQTVAGVAAKDYALTKSSILLGVYGTPASIPVVVSNLTSSPFSNTSQAIKVTIYRIPNTGTNPLVAPELQQQLTLMPQNNQISFTVNNVGDKDAFNIILSR